MWIIAVALAIAAGITLLALSRAKDGYEDERGFHPGAPGEVPQVVTAIRVEKVDEPSTTTAQSAMITDLLTRLDPASPSAAGASGVAFRHD